MPILSLTQNESLKSIGIEAEPSGFSSAPLSISLSMNVMNTLVTEVKMPQHNLFVVGDSISLDYGPHLAAALSPAIKYARKSGEDMAYQNLDIPQGANGGDSGMVLDYLKARVGDVAFQPDLLLVNAGLHDIKTDPASGLRQVPVDRYRQNLEAIVALAARNGWRLAWIRTTPVDDATHNSRQRHFQRHSADVETWNKVADSVMTAAGIPVADLYRFTCSLGDPVTLFRDHVHFHPAVSKAQGTWLAEWVSGAMQLG